MVRHLLRKNLSMSQLEMRELGLRDAGWPICRTFLISLALADIAATTLMLLSH